MESISFLGPEAYLGFHRLLDQNERRIEATHIAQVKFDGYPAGKPAYVKIYRDNERGLVNEVVGYVLAKNLGLIVPSQAAIIWIEKDHLNTVSDLDQFSSPNEHQVLAWCTGKEDALSVKLALDYADPDDCFTKYERFMTTFFTEYHQSMAAPSNVAFDDWVANVDRNCGNLLRINANRYILIDHGMILGSNTWNAATLQAFTGPCWGKINHYAIHFDTDEQTQKKFFQKVKMTCTLHEKKLLEIKSNLVNLLERFLDPADAQAVYQFLDRRAQSTNIQARYRL